MREVTDKNGKGITHASALASDKGRNLAHSHLLKATLWADWKRDGFIKSMKSENEFYLKLIPSTGTMECVKYLLNKTVIFIFYGKQMDKYSLMDWYPISTRKWEKVVTEGTKIFSQEPAMGTSIFSVCIEISFHPGYFMLREQVWTGPVFYYLITTGCFRILIDGWISYRVGLKEIYAFCSEY